MMVREEVLIWEARNPGRRVTARRHVLSALTRNLAGLTLQHARQLARNAIYDDGVISEADIPSAMQKKYELLDQEGALSFESAYPREAGGLRGVAVSKTADVT
ncbi:MAG: hypothetical protein ACREX4_06395 [Gammaproteobacteria bacterium]